jgi:hypothetical protein
MIVDDGSHAPDHQMATSRSLWPSVKACCICIIEVRFSSTLERTLVHLCPSKTQLRLQDLLNHYCVERAKEGYQPPDLPV